MTLYVISISNHMLKKMILTLYTRKNCHLTQFQDLIKQIILEIL
jgi:hypothetical protein